MNFIAADCAISLFPHATFVKRVTLTMQFEVTGWYMELQDKYSRRGYATVPWHASSFALGQRWIQNPTSDVDMLFQRVVTHRPHDIARQTWVLPLHGIPARDADCEFRCSRSHALPQSRSSERPAGVDYWCRNGFTLRQSVVGFSFQFSILACDDKYQYCVPSTFQKFVATKILAVQGSSAEEIGKRCVPLLVSDCSIDMVLGWMIGFVTSNSRGL